MIFVRGATEAINLVARSWGAQNVHAGDEIIVSHLEHHANIVPWQQLAASVGATLRVIPVDDSASCGSTPTQRCSMSAPHSLPSPRCRTYLAP